jgi:hypothetical protein
MITREDLEITHYPDNQIHVSIKGSLEHSVGEILRELIHGVIHAADFGEAYDLAHAAKDKLKDLAQPTVSVGERIAEKLEKAFLLSPYRRHSGPDSIRNTTAAIINSELAPLTESGRVLLQQLWLHAAPLLNKVDPLLTQNLEKRINSELATEQPVAAPNKWIKSEAELASFRDAERAAQPVAEWVECPSCKDAQTPEDSVACPQCKGEQRMPVAASAIVTLTHATNTLSAQLAEVQAGIVARHKSDEKANKGRYGMPQGPCQCPTCLQSRIRELEQRYRDSRKEINDTWVTLGERNDRIRELEQEWKERNDRLMADCETLQSRIRELERDPPCSQSALKAVQELAQEWFNKCAIAEQQVAQLDRELAERNKDDAESSI